MNLFLVIAFMGVFCLSYTPKKAYAGNIVLGLTALETGVVASLVALTAYGAYKTHIGDWGACGTERIDSREILNINTGKFETYHYPKCSKKTKSAFKKPKKRSVDILVSADGYSSRTVGNPDFRP